MQRNEERAGRWKEGAGKRGSFSVLLWPDSGDAVAAAAVCSLLIANAEQSLLNGYSCCLFLAFFTNSLSLSLSVSVFYRFHIDKRCQHRCSWKCLSIALIFISVVLTAMLAYFAGKHKDQRKGRRREEGEGRGAPYGHVLSLSLSLLPLFISVHLILCVCVCGQRCVVITASAVNEKYTYKCKYSSIHTNTHSHIHSLTHSLAHPYTLTHSHNKANTSKCLLYISVKWCYFTHTHTHARMQRQRNFAHANTTNASRCLYPLYLPSPSGCCCWAASCLICPIDTQLETTTANFSGRLTSWATPPSAVN